MAVLTRTTLQIAAVKDTFPLGPWPFGLTASFAEFFGTFVVIGATTQTQIFGGVAPVIAAITTGQYLLIYADQDVKVGLHGVSAQGSGFTLTALCPLLISGGSLNALSIYNTAAVGSNVFLGIGGS